MLLGTKDSKNIHHRIKHHIFNIIIIKWYFTSRLEPLCWRVARWRSCSFVPRVHCLSMSLTACKHEKRMQQFNQMLNIININNVIMNIHRNHDKMFGTLYINICGFYWQQNEIQYLNIQEIHGNLVIQQVIFIRQVPDTERKQKP